MGNRAPLTFEEKERIYEGKLKGQTLLELAKELNCSPETVRKWWRRGRKKGLEGLRARRRGRSAAGTLSQFDPLVAQKAEEYKRQHKGWGANRALIDLRKDRELQGMDLPKPSRLAAFFKERCPDRVANYHPRPPSPRKHPPTSVHEIWQMDNQEMIRLTTGDLALISNIRDPYGAAPIASLAFSGNGRVRCRKLTFAEYRQVLRAGFTEWHTLPEKVGTDNELRFIGNPSSDFPSLITLYLVGLGIQHVFIRPGIPTDHAEVERGHRILDNWAFDDESLQDLEHLQQALDRERKVYLQEFPCHASDCNGRPPLVAHPELLHPRRCYQPDEEPLLFVMQRVYDYLAEFTFERKVSSSGCVCLVRQVSIGRNLARQLKDRLVWIRCEPLRKEWIIYQKPENKQDELVELVHRPIKYLDYEMLTGLNPVAPLPARPVQLYLPFPVHKAD